MADPLPLRGMRGAIRWYYYVAAGVTDWTVRYDRARACWTLRGGLVAPDPFKLTQTPLEFVVPTKGGGRLCWPILTITATDNRIAATLGPGAPT
jgi:hypothetical protein